MAFTPQYITNLNWVKEWLYGKVTFGNDPFTTITDTFLGTLISYAEGEVQRRLNKFYTIPFVAIDGGAFTSLPQMTQEYLINLMVMMSVIFVLKVDFAQKSTNIAENYIKSVQDQYYSMMNSNFSRDVTGRFNLPPLPGLKINPLMYTGITVMPAPVVVDQFPGVANMNNALNQITKTYANWWQFLPYGCQNAFFYPPI